MNKKRLILGLLLSLSMGFRLGVASAEDSLQTFELDEMVVTATRTMKEIRQVPSSVSVVTAEDIKQKNITSVTEALQTLPGVYLSKKAQGSIMLRGFDSTDILVLLDGQQMNTTYNNGMEWEMLPVENIERIEVVRGSGSSLYGGRAVAGVINIISKENKKPVDINAAYSYGSNNTQKKAFYANIKANEKLAIGVGYENRSSDGFKGYYYTGKASTGAGAITPSKPIPQLSDGSYILGGRGEKKWESENYTTNIKYKFDENRSLKYTFLHNESEYRYVNPFSNVYDSNGNPVFSGTVNVGGGKRVSLSPGTFLGYDGNKESDVHILNYNDQANKLAVNLSYTDMKKNGYSSPSSPTSINWNGAGTDSFYPGETYNFDIQKCWENIGKHTLLLGANYRQESFEQKRLYLTNWRDHSSVDSSLGKNGLYETHGGKAKNVALFVQDEYKLSEPVTMYLGVRYDRFTKTDGFSDYYNKTTGALTRSLDYDSVSYNEISPKLAVNIKANETTNYYASYGHSFNPPPLYQVYRDGGGSMGSVVANPDLDPETSDTLEIGMKKQVNAKTDLGISLYQVKTEDKIIYTTHYQPGTSIALFKKYENYGTEKRRGVELEVNHKISDKFSSYLNYAWQSGKVEQKTIVDTNLKDTSSSDYGIPKHLLHAGIKYKYGKWNNLLEAQYVSARQAPDAVTGEYNSEDAFFIVNTAFNYQINKTTSVQFAVENLLNKQFYCSEATSGRSYSLGVRYNF